MRCWRLSMLAAAGCLLAGCIEEPWQGQALAPPPMKDPVGHSAVPADGVDGAEPWHRAPGGTSQLAPLALPGLVASWAATAGGTAAESPARTNVDVEERGEVNLGPDIWDPNAFKRVRRRMTVEQLKDAITHVTGGINWAPLSNWYGTRWDELASTLGVPDYFRKVRPDLAPSMTFQKFLADGASAVCADLITTEAGLPPDQRVFFVHADPGVDPLSDPAATDTNIEMLLLRFHGKDVDAGDAEFEPWRNLVVQTAAAPEMPPGGAAKWWDAWTTLCMGLFQHPDFFSY